MKINFTLTVSALCCFLFSTCFTHTSFAQGLPNPSIDGDPAFLTSSGGTRIYGKIPATKYDVYQLNNADYIDGLFDGDTTTSVHAGWGHIFYTQETWVQLRDYNAQITHLRLMNDYPHTSPVAYYAVERGTWNRIYLGSSNGSPSQAWSQIPAQPLTTPVNASYLIIVGEMHFPKELRIMGSHIPPPSVAAPERMKKPFKNTIGNNFFEWDALESDTDPNDRYRIQENKMATLKIFKGGLRHYLDWERIETSQGVYEFNPTNNGGWNYDMVYQRLKQEEVPVAICVKTVPPWMLNSWPAEERDGENVPVFFQNNMAETVSSFENPASYIAGGKFFFQLAARYGRNSAVNMSLLSGVATGPIWPGDPNSPVRTRVAGLNYIEYLEMENERDKWWKGRKAYQTGREYAAMASAYYDGHKGTLGNNVGAKQADSTMKIVVGGLALVRTDYIQGMIDWCRQYRGYKANGEVDLCFDIINYHHYSNDAGSPQYGYSTRGQAPELSNLTEGIDRFIKFSNEKCFGKEVWITESGYDVHQGSIQKAIAIGSKTGKEVQGDWILRSSLLLARKGIDRVMYYMFKDVCNCDGVFASSGFVESNTLLSARRPSGDYLKQATDVIGNYRYHSTLHTDPMVDQYKSGDTSVYVAWIPDETGRTGTYTMTLPVAHSRVKLYTLVKGSDSISISIQPAPGGIYTIQASETPVFVQPLADVILPVMITYFTATYRSLSKDAALSWHTTWEAAAQLFIIQRSVNNGQTWVTLGSVPAAGNSPTSRGYNYIDARPQQGKNLYRLKQIDADNSSTYSKTVMVEVESDLILSLAPNPAKGVTYLSISNAATQEAEISIRDAAGKLLWTRAYKLNLFNPAKLELSKYSVGVYFITIKIKEIIKIEKMIIQ